MEKFKTAANETQSKYGKKSHPAIFLIFQKIIKFAKIKTQRKIISTKAQNGLSNPKNKIDHKTFKTSCAVKTEIAIFFILLSISLCQIKYKANPIKI